MAIERTPEDIARFKADMARIERSRAAQNLAQREIQERLIADDVFDQDIDGYAASAAAAELIYHWQHTPEITDDDRYNDVGNAISQLERFRRNLDAIDLMALETSSPPEPPKRALRCDMSHACAEPVTHVDETGALYCRAHGITRKTFRRCRQLKPAELAALRSGGTIRYSKPKPEPEPDVRQTVCRYCGLDIEGFTKTEPAVWRDRGGETSCRGGGEHEPV